MTDRLNTEVAVPLGWTPVSFGAVVTLKTGPFGSALHKSDYVIDGVPLINPTHIRDGRLVPDMSITVSDPTKARLTEYVLQSGDVVMGRRGEMGRCAVVSGDAVGWICGTGSVVVRPKMAITSNFLQKFLSSPVTVAALNGDAVGSTMVNLNQSVLLNLTVNLPPLPEQTRIAEKIDTVLTRVDACRDRLARVAPLLKRFRQSVLAAATSGRLTADWRDDQKVISALDWIETINESRIHLRRSAIKPRREDIILSDGIPDSWCVTGLDEIAADKPNALKAGPFGSALKKSMYVNDGYKVYGQEQVIAGDENTGDYYISEEKFRELDSCKVIPGDILVSLVGTIGRVLILSATARVGIINPRLVKFSLHPGVHRAFFALYLQSPLATAFFQGKSHGGTMDILNLGILRSLPILLPSPAEQVEIVRRVETLFAFADRLEARLKTAQTATDRLTPALLAKAFRGELVPQDPNDEPAAELLKRLAASRDDAPKAKRGRRCATTDTKS